MISKTMLVYLDGTAPCESVFPYVIRLAAAGNGKVLLACTTREFEHSVTRAGMYLEHLIAQLSAQPSPIADRVDIWPVVGSADPIDHVLAGAKRHCATEIVVSATLKTSLRRTLLKHAPVPVIIAHTVGTNQHSFTGTVLVPVDGSADAEAAMPYAVTFARAANLPLTLLAVVPTIQDMLVRFGPLYPYPWIFFPSSALEAAEGTVAQDMYHYLTGLRDRWSTPDWSRILVRLDHGNVIPGIAQAADILNAGLIVISAGAYRSGWQWLVPGVPNAVANLTRRPVLVIHAPSQHHDNNGKRLERAVSPVARTMTEPVVMNDVNQEQ